MRLGAAGRACSLAFLTAGATLATQVLVHRVISAKLASNFAFLVISLTMLGFALSGVLLTRLLPAFLSRLPDAVTACASLFSLSTLSTTIAFYRADISESAASRPQFVAFFLATLPHALLFALPFAFCGLILGALLAAPELPTRRIYCWDLVGSACGAFAVIEIIARVGVENGLLAICALMTAGSLWLAPPRRAPVRVLATLALLAVAACWTLKARAFDMRYPAGTTLARVKSGGGQYEIETMVWDPVARIEVSRMPPIDTTVLYWSSLIGGNEAFHSRFKRVLTQNNNAWTYAVAYDGTRESLTGIEETVYSAAYQATSVERPKVAIIGVGGGFDVLTALYFGAGDITGVEVNAATISILTERYRDYFRPWVGDPRVHLVRAEGRNYLSTTHERYDVLQLSGVDSFSGTPAAAHVFSENYLYTAEAFDLYLTRLTDAGILNVMRLEYRPPQEMLRALVTCVAALRRAGVARPADHIATVTAKPSANFTALLVKRTPFTAAERQRLAAWADANPYLFVSGAPGLGLEAGLYQQFLSLDDPARERDFVAAYPWDIAPATDDWPFFFRHSFWWHLFPSDPGIWIVTPVMEYTTLILLGVIGFAGWVSIYVPLRYLAGQGRSPATGRYALYFTGAGLGYMAVEIALLQRFGLFLGHPNYALSAVLASLLLATGIGSMYSDAIVGRLGQLRFVSYVLAAVLLFESEVVFPRLPGLLGLAFPLRVLLVAALILPIGLCLGTFIPFALERLKRETPSYVPWAWGLNGIASVLSPVLSVAFSMTWGINALLLTAILVYLATGLAFPRLARSEVPASAAATPS